MSAAHLPPPPSTVTATTNAKEGDQVAVIERDGLRLGTAADAGRLCVTDRSAEGVSGDLYRYYVREQGAPAPYQVKDPITRKLTSARDADGRELFDLDAVAAWNDARPGPGSRVNPGRPVKWTALRWDLLAGARDGRLTQYIVRDYLAPPDAPPLDEGLRKLAREHPGESLELRARPLQRLGELIGADLIHPAPPRSGRYRLTAAGRRWLDEHAGHAAKAAAAIAAKETGEPCRT